MDGCLLFLTQIAKIEFESLVLVKRRAEKERHIEMTNKGKSEDELRPEYGSEFWKDAVRGKYAQRYAASAKEVRLAPDVATIFPNDEYVNEALRIVLRVMNETNQLARRCSATENTSGTEDVGQFFRDTELLEVGEETL